MITPATYLPAPDASPSSPPASEARERGALKYRVLFFLAIVAGLMALALGVLAFSSLAGANKDVEYTYTAPAARVTVLLPQFSAGGVLLPLMAFPLGYIIWFVRFSRRSGSTVPSGETDERSCLLQKAIKAYETGNLDAAAAILRKSPSAIDQENAVNCLDATLRGSSQMTQMMGYLLQKHLEQARMSPR
jgi:hypothetical protein